MKLSKSKLALAKVINENGGWVDVADCATQDKDGWVCSYEGKPTRCGDSWKDNGDCLYKYGFDSREKIPNWHQCVLSREEYYQAYPKADADGWIEWNGGECPVDGESIVEVEFNNSRHSVGRAIGFSWFHEWKYSNIIKYRLHKSEVKVELCESVARSIPEPESKSTIEQLAQDYRNKLDFAKRKQQEADDAKVAAYAALGELERAGDELGLIIGVKKPTHELSITDWRDLQVGDIVFIESMRRKNAWSSAMVGRECIVVEDGEDYPICFANDFTPEGQSYWVGGVDDGDIVWRFIRRP